MSLIKLTPGGELPARDGGGSIFFMRGGRPQVRQAVSGVNPASESQLNERAGVSAASRQWAYHASATVKSAWGSAAPAGMSGSNFAVGESS